MIKIHYIVTILSSCYWEGGGAFEGISQEVMTLHSWEVCFQLLPAKGAYKTLKWLEHADPIQKLQVAFLTGRQNSPRQFPQSTLWGNKASVEIRKNVWCLKMAPVWVLQPRVRLAQWLWVNKTDIHTQMAGMWAMRALRRPTRTIPMATTGCTGSPPRMHIRLAEASAQVRAIRSVGGTWIGF